MQIDGGKGQLSAALRGLEEAGVTDLCVCSLAKREEEV
jgi:excinuclease UvrABC nuclease subunit